MRLAMLREEIMKQLVRKGVPLITKEDSTNAALYFCVYLKCLCHNLECLIIDHPKIGYYVMMLYRRPSLSRPSVTLKSLKMSVLRMLGHL